MNMNIFWQNVSLTCLLHYYECIFQTKKLQVKYSLKSRAEVFEIRDEKCVIMGTKFYFHEKHVESVMEVNKEVARFFSNGDTDCMVYLRYVSCVCWWYC